MRLPAFYERVPRLRVYDALAEALGSAEGGILEYGYADAVRMAGHSCPTVASAYWLTCLAMTSLYEDRLPERGGVRVEFRDDLHSGANGVAACIVQMLTGAAGEGGFRGIGGRFARAGLQRFAPELPLAMRFTRLDNGTAVDAQADLTLLPHDPELPPLLAQCAFGRCAPGALARLGELWQQRVEYLLLDRAEDQGLFVLRRVAGARAMPSVCVALA